MPRWLKLVRGMIGMGLTFSLGVGMIAGVVAGLVSLFPGSQGGVELFRMVVASAVWAFPIGVVFSGLLASTVRGRSFDELSLPRFAALGAGGGMLLFGVLAANAYQAWSLPTALANLAIFLVLGSGSATVTLLLARRGRPALEPGDESRRLEDG